MRIIITVALLFIFSAVSGQRIVPIGGNRTTDTGLIVGSLKVDSVLVFPAYRGANENLVLGFDSRGKAVLRINNDSLIYATRRYVDSVANAITAGAVDTNNYIASITRLNTEIDSIANIIDSNNTIIYGSITELYDTKANKDTLNNFVLHTYLDSTLAHYADTGLLALKQNYSDTTTVDATRYWVSTQIPSLAGYVPYTGATTDVDLGTHSISARTGVINKPSGSGTALSVTKGGNGEALTVTKTSGSGNAMSVTGGITLLETLHTTTKIADAYIASALNWNGKYGTTDTGRGTSNIVTGGSLNKVRDSLAALNTGGTVTSIQLVGGTGVTITPTIAATTVGVFTISATGGGGGSAVSASTGQVLYKSGTDTTIRGADKVGIDTTDGRLVFPYNNDTSQVLTSYTGGNKVYTRNTNGRASVMVVDTSAIPYALQGALNAQQYSTVVPNVTIGGAFSATRDGLFSNAANSAVPVNGTTYALATATYSATNTQSNYARGVVPTAAGAGSFTGMRTSTLAQPPGIICPTTKYGRGGGRGTFMFSLPAYAATQFFYYGYHDKNDATYTTPSTFFNTSNSVGIGKDVTDTTLQFMWSSSFPAGVQKVSTGITPNSEDVYRITVYISPVSDFYIQLEVINNNAPTVVRIYKVPSTDPNKPIPAARKLMFVYFIGNGVTAGAVSYGLIKLTEEIY
jgi:hypothetical protein